MLSQSHAYRPTQRAPCLFARPRSPLFSIEKRGTMHARPALRFLLTTYPHLFKRANPLLLNNLIESNLKSESFLLRIIQGRDLK